MKDVAKQGAQQGRPQQQPQQPGQNPGQPQQRPSRPGQQQQPGAQVNDSGPFKPNAGTKIEEKVLAPVQEGASFEVSPHGVHVATVATDGSRGVVFFYDGVVGPKFDQILALPTGRNARIAFSSDGNRYAYCARAGNGSRLIMDGVPQTQSVLSGDTIDMQNPSALKYRNNEI